MANAILSADRVSDLLSYNTETGVLTRKVRTSNRVNIGDVAGTVRPDGYLKVSLENKSYLAHRLAWAIAFGEWPEFEIDHINGVRSDNRLCNLRDVTPSTNQENQRVPYRNSAGKTLGVTFHKRNKKWQAQIKYGGKNRYLGQFASKEDASSAYLEAKRRQHIGCTI